MWGWVSPAAILISRRNRSAPIAAEISGRSTLRATLRSWRRSWARNTTAMPPSAQLALDGVAAGEAGVEAVLEGAVQSWG